MPLKAGRSRKVISENIRDMLAAGHPKAQAVAASLRTAGIKRKGATMEKHGKGKHEHGMAGELGMSPRKAMASGKTDGGSFGMESFGAMNGGTGAHPDHVAHTGMKPHLGDHERATPPAIHHTKGHMPAQAAPRHGPHHPGGHGEHFKREAKA